MVPRHSVQETTMKKSSQLVRANKRKAKAKASNKRRRARSEKGRK